MALHTILFDLFASLAVATACGVIVSENPIHSVIFLILVFCNATGLLLLFKVELLAMMFIIIYVGAIAVLFLFVVMMLNIKIGQDPITEDEKIQGTKKETSNKTRASTKVTRSLLIVMTAITMALTLIFDQDLGRIGTQGV